VLKELLESWGMTVATTTSAREAIDQADDRVHDVVLMDLRIPELDGYTAAKAIRARGGRLATLPIIAVSGSMRMGAMGAIEAAGFTGFVGKPIRPDVLAAEIRKHTRQPR